MPSADEAVRRYDTPFQRHLSFFDRDGDGVVYFGESLRGNLAIGIDFPVAVAMAFGYHTLYGNTRPFFLGPLRGIDIAKVQSRRNMLEQVHLDEVPRQGMGRQTLVAASYAHGFLDKMHVNGLWALAASRLGTISADDIELYQRGVMFLRIGEAKSQQQRSRPAIVSWRSNKCRGP